MRRSFLCIRLLYFFVSTLHIYIEQINLSLEGKMEPEERGEQSFSSRFFFLFLFVENRSTGYKWKWRNKIYEDDNLKYLIVSMEK